MKAITSLLLVSFFSFTTFTQGKSQENKSEPIEEQQEKSNTLNRENTRNELFGEESKSDDSSETKSFTLDVNDAVLEDKVVLEPLVSESEGDEAKVYHYNSYYGDDEIETLAGRNSHHGGFGAVSFRASEFNNKDIILIGFRGGWIINRSLAIGMEGYGIIPTAEYEQIDPSNPLPSRSVGGYGGLFLEPIVLSNKVVHVTFPVSAGAGWLGYIVDWEQNYHYYPDDLIDDDVFWYLEPGAAVELNVARNFRINMGASYRFTKDLELVNTSSSAFDAWNYFLTLKFGSF